MTCSCKAKHVTCLWKAETLVIRTILKYTQHSRYNHSFVPNNLLQIWTISFIWNDYSAFTSI